MARDMSGEEALSYEEAMAVIGETWEYLNSCFRRNDLVLSAIEAATESFESINLTIYAVPEEQGGDKALDSFMLHFPAFPA